MIVLVDDERTHLDALFTAALKEGIPRDRLQKFSSAGEAQKFLDQTAGNRQFPVALVSDWALSDLKVSGITLLPNAELRAESIGSGIWTFLVTSYYEEWMKLGYYWQPFSAFDKHATNWAGNLAKVLAALMREGFDLDRDDDNDFAPPISCPLADRIYVYSSGGANHFSPHAGEAEETKVFALSNEKYEDVDTVVVMYRGRYIVSRESPTLARALLRWRTLLLDHLNAPSGRKDAHRPLIRDMYLWEKRGDGNYYLTPEDQWRRKEMNLLSLHNDFTNFRGDERIKKLGTSLFFDKDFLPPFHQVRGITKEELKYGAVPYDDPRISAMTHNNFLPVPVGLQKKVSDGFMTRLHFVLTENERDIHLRWKESQREMTRR